MSPVTNSGISAFGDLVYSVREPDWIALHAAAGLTEDPSTGLIVGYINQAGAGDSGNANFVVEVDSGGIVVYRNVGTPDPMATATDTYGGFEVFHVPTGPATLTATDGVVVITTSVYIYPDTAHLVRAYDYGGN